MGKITLGKYLKSLRTVHKFTLREVEGITGVSNAYLCQIEKDKVSKPSVNILFKLAECYKVPYNNMLEKSGYIPKTPPNYSLATNIFSHIKITDKEAEELLEYLEFKRSKVAL